MTDVIASGLRGASDVAICEGRDTRLALHAFGFRTHGVNACLVRAALAVGLLLVAAAGLAACGTGLSASDQPATDYVSLVNNLGAAGAPVEDEGEVEQPFLAVKGRVIKVQGEHVQVFEYRSAAETDAQAALVSPSGSAVGTTKLHWMGPPHFYKNGRLLVLYIGDNAKVLATLEALLGRQFAGQ